MFKFVQNAYLVDILEKLTGLVVGAHQLVAAVIVNIVREAVALLAHLKIFNKKTISTLSKLTRFSSLAPPTTLYRYSRRGFTLLVVR